MSILKLASLIVTPNAYEESKILAVVPSNGSGDLDFVRASTKTRVNPQGFITDSCKNLLSFSEDFGNAVYQLNAGTSISLNQSLSPSNTLTADNYVGTGASGIIQRNSSFSVGNNVVFSIFVKANGANNKFRLFGDSSLISSNFTATNDWVRYSFPITVVNGGALRPYGIIRDSSDNNVNVFIWGAQLELGSSATSYFPTTDRLNVPSIDYTGGGCPSILLEPQATNLRSYSESIISARGYSLVNAVLDTASITNPFGLSSANLLKLNSGANAGNSNEGFDFGGLVLANNTQYVQSLFVKPFGSTTLRLRNNAAGGTANFILTGAGTAPANIIGLQASTILAYINGWYRISWTFTTGTTAPSNRADFYAIKTDVADGVNGVYVFGAQLELGEVKTSYIPTQASAVTRLQDQLIKTGISSLIGQTEGAIFLSLKGFFNDFAANKFITINDGTTNNMIGLFLNTSGEIVAYIRTNSITNAVSTGVSQNSTSKIAIKYTTNSYKIFINGTLRNTIYFANPISGTLSKFNSSQADGGSAFNGNLNNIQLYKTALSDEECILLTSTSYNTYQEMATALNYVTQ